jgi:hypothetical protein
MTVSATTARSDAYTGLVHYALQARKTAKEDDTSPAYRIEDRIEVSDFGQQLSAIQKHLGDPNLTDRYAFPAEIAAFRTELANRFQVAGIDTSVPLDLWVDASGTVRVAADHPDKAKIEALLASDPALANLARQLAGTVSLVRALDEHKEFAKAYARDPQLAVVQFAHLLVEAKGDIGFRFVGDEMTLLSPVVAANDDVAGETPNDETARRTTGDTAKAETAETAAGAVVAYAAIRPADASTQATARVDERA